MRNLLAFVSYTLAAMSGICFVGGIAISINGEGSIDMDGLENVISVLDYVLDTKRKRHIMGGILLSVSFLFGGLAITVMTIKNEEEEDEQ